MDSSFTTRDTLLNILLDELNARNQVFSDMFSELQRLSQFNEDSIGVCGFPCVGDCQTCTQSNADLDAFFGLAPAAAAPAPAPAPAPEPAADVAVNIVSASVEGSGPSSAEEPPYSENSPEVIVVTHVIEPEAETEEEEVLEVARAMDQNEDAHRSGEAYELEDDYSSYDERDAYDYDRYDNDYGLDWNESGYFD